MEAERMRVLVVVKAAPVLTRRLEETMCVAAVRLDDPVDWVRLHPVPFRDLDDESKFAKYQALSVDVIRPRSDRRPESWSPIHGSIAPTEAIDTAHGWAQRRQVIERLSQPTMCELIAANQSGSGPGVPSLGVVRPVDPPKLKITKREDDQLREWTRRAQAAGSQMSLFDEPGHHKPDFEVVPWRFQYEYRCAATGCAGHTQTIVDWEVLALWRRVRGDSDWREQMRIKFEEKLWWGRDSLLFVGNQEQYPTSFLVLGVFWPPAGPAQAVMDL